MRVTKLITYIIFLFSFSNVAAEGFIENKGQFDKSIISRLDLSTHTISMLNDGFSVLLHDQKEWAKMITHYHDNLMHNHSDQETNKIDTFHFQLLKYSFIGANFNTLNFSQPSKAYFNFYL